MNKTIKTSTKQKENAKEVNEDNAKKENQKHYSNDKVKRKGIMKQRTARKKDSQKP